MPAGYMTAVKPTTVPSPVPTETANSAAQTNTQSVKVEPVRLSFQPSQTMASTSPESARIPEKAPAQSQQTTATAGFYNTVGFNDDTRAFLSSPARHDVARRVDCAFLATLVAEHQIGMEEAGTIAGELAYGLVRKAYRL